MEKLVPVPQAAQLLDMSQRKMWDLIKNGEIAHYRFGRLVRLDVADVRAYAERNRIGGQA